MHLRDSRPRALALVAALLVARPLAAGLIFHRVPAPQGADVAALAGDSSRLYAATIRGVWRYEAGLWALDGLPDRTLLSIAVMAGTPFAVDGAHVYRRIAAGSWVFDDPSPPLAFPSVLVAKGSILYAAGLGVAKCEGNVWSALPSPGLGIARAATVTDAGDLVIGFGGGTAARLSGGVWTPLSGGIGSDETVQALVSFGGLLYAGTQKGVYAQFGTAWTKDATFGTHDVRALTAALGTLRGATADAGVFAKGGASWTNESGTFLTFFTKSFGTVGSDLYAGTGGGPVYRFVSGSWSEAKDGLDAAIVSEVSTGWSVVTTLGAGAAALDGTAISVPAGCGSLPGSSAVLGTGLSTPAHLLLVSNPCGGIFLESPVTAGLPQGTFFTSVAEVDGFTGTSNAGVQLFTGSSWVPLNAGLSDNASVQTIRTIFKQAAFDTYASVGSSVFQLSQNNVWTDVSPGLPQGALPLALAGSTPTVYAGLAAGGVFRRDGTSIFREDAAGLKTLPVFSLDPTSRGLAAAVGTSGVRVKRGGGWAAENVGLPSGVEVRVVRADAHALYAGTAGSGLFSASTDPALRTIPVVLDVVGGAGARFRTELTIGNRGASAALLHVTFTPAPGFGAPQVAGGAITTTLAAGTELRAADALDFLRSAGLAIPPATSSSPIAGSLSVTADAGAIAGAGTDSVYAIARTYTSDAGGGTYGLFYDAPSDLEAAEEEGYVYGLRSVANVSRSNLAMVHLTGRSADAITLAVQVYSANGVAAGPPIPVTLEPGEWRQLNGILGLAGLPDGSFGWARITRTSGVGPWSAYGVVNDAKTSDGSYLPLFRPGGVTAARRLLVPSVLDVFGASGSHFTTELTLVNDGPIATPVDLFYQPAPGAGSAPGVAFVTVNLAASEQKTIPDILQYLRQHGVNVPSASTGAQVGTLEVSFRFLGSLDAPRTVALARTSTPNPNSAAGGAFGLFYAAIARGGGARTSAIVPALTEDAGVRSNLALVNAGGGSGSTITLSVQLHDSATGTVVGHAITATLAPGDWVQYSRVLSVAGAIGATSRAYAVVRRLSGDDTFYAYGVLNDNVTSDGSFLAMIPADRD
jgi:hypothetical protein